MDAFGARRQRRLDNAVLAQIAFAARRRPQLDAFICSGNMESGPVGGRMNGDVRMPRRLAVRMIRSAISPRLAISTDLNKPASS